MSTDASREAFEAWLAGHDPRSFCPNAYWEHDYKWKAWQASRKQALEETAKRSDAYAYMSENFTALSEEIRRMK